VIDYCAGREYDALRKGGSNMDRYKPLATVAFSLTCVGAMMLSSLKAADVPVGQKIEHMRRTETGITFTVTPTAGSVTG
jgi:hypothetical protein